MSKTLRRRRWLLALVSPLVVLLLLEVGLRATGFGDPPARYFDSIVGNQLFAPDQVHAMVHRGEPLAQASINAQGFRGPWPVGPKAAGVTRVLCLGDSFTFGWSVADDQTYPRQLADLLAAEQLEVQVLNAGIPNHNTENTLRLYHHRLRSLDLDVVVLGVVPNDLEPTMTPVRVVGGGAGRFVRGTALFDAWSEMVGSETALLEQDQDGRQWEHKALLDDNKVQVLINPGQGAGPVLIESWRPSFEGLLAELRADGVPVLVVIFPARFQVVRGRSLRARGEDPTSRLKRLTGWQDVLAAICRREGVPSVDMLGPFVQADAPYGQVDLGHPSVEGYRLTAEAVAQELLGRGWVR